MSTREWESGTITLPKAEFVRMRQAMQDTDQRIKQQAFDMTKDFWKSLTRKQQTDPEAYRLAVFNFADSKKEELGQRVRTWSGWDTVLDPETDSAVSEAHQLIAPEWGHLRLRGGKPSRIRKSDVSFPTSRSVRFFAGEASITFDREKHTVEWDVPDNNLAIGKAHRHAMGATFFNQLEGVAWTRDTGGVISGSDEYQSDMYRGDEPKEAFGPVGAAEAPDVCKPYTDARGRRVTREDLDGTWQEKFEARLSAQQNRAKPASSGGVQGRDRIGRFAEMHRSEPTFRLR